MDSGGPKEAQVQLYSPGGANVSSHVGTLAPPGEYDWTVRLRRRCGFMSNYFVHLFVHVACVRGSVLLRHVDDRPHRLSGEGWQECTARANCNLRLRCCFYYVISMIKAAEHFSNPFHMFVEMVSSLYDTITLENFCMVLKVPFYFRDCVCPVEAPLKLNCREMSIMEMSWFICHRFFCEVSVGLAAVKPAWNSFPRNVSHGNSPQNFHGFFVRMKPPWNEVPWCVHHGKSMAFVPPIFHGFPMGFLSVWSPMEWSSMVRAPWKIHGACTTETPWNSRSYLPLWNPHGMRFHGVYTMENPWRLNHRNSMEFP